MPLLEVILLGIVQGLTEFLPVSSTAHLAILPRVFGWPDPGLSYDIALHVGTLIAVLLYFFRDWVQIIGQAFGFRAVGDPNLRRPYVIATAMIVVGGFLWLAEHFSRRKKDLSHVRLLDSISIGMAQAIAVIPGGSRSGVNIPAGPLAG